MRPPFQRAGGDRERVAQHEIDGGDGGETRNGSKIELLTIWPARASSTKPTTEASEVFLTICTMKPTVGGVAMRSACGRIT